MSDPAALLPACAAAALAASAVALLVQGPRAGRRGPLSRDPARRRQPAGGSAGPERDLVDRHRAVVCVLAGAAPVLLLGGVVGVVGGVLVGGFVFRVLARRKPAWLSRHEERVARDLPQVVDLLAVTLAAGTDPVSALAAVTAAVDGPVVAQLRAAQHALALGRDPVRVWRETAQRPGLAALGRTMSRAVESGASVSDALHRLAEDLHAAATLEAESRARTVGVRAAAPLGLCLLPAFVLVGVVPLVASTVGSLLAR